MNASSPPRRAVSPAALARVAVIIAALVAFARLVRRAELGRALALVVGVGPKAALVLAPWGVALTLHAFGTTRILGALGRRTSLPRVLSVVVSAEALLMSLPGGAALAEGIGPYLLLRRCGVPIPEGLAAAAAKKALVVLTNGLTIGIAVLAGGAWLRSASQALVGGDGLLWIVATAGALLVAGALALVRVMLSGTLALRAHALLLRVPIAAVRRWIAEHEPGFVATDRQFARLSGARTGAFILASGAFLCAWLAEASEAWLILRLLGVNLPYSEVLAFEVVVSLLKSLAFAVPAGVGVQDAGYVAFFSAFGIADAATVGVAFVVIKRAKEAVWVAAGMSLFAILRDRGVGAEIPSDGPTHDEPFG